MATKSKTRASRKRSVQAKSQESGTRRPRWLYPVFAAAFVALVIASALATRHNGGGAKLSAGLPQTPDYHSLLVNPSNSQRLLLGTHTGLYVSRDGGRQWRFDALSGNDAMNLARPAGNPDPAAGCAGGSGPAAQRRTS